MPLYEYRCRQCGREFELLVRQPMTPACPACESADLERLLSLFTGSSEATKKANLQAGRKHNSKEARDRAVAEREEIEHHRH